MTCDCRSKEYWKALYDKLELEDKYSVIPKYIWRKKNEM